MRCLYPQNMSFLSQSNKVGEEVILNRKHTHEPKNTTQTGKLYLCFQGTKPPDNKNELYIMFWFFLLFTESFFVLPRYEFEIEVQ